MQITLVNGSTSAQTTDLSAHLLAATGYRLDGAAGQGDGDGEDLIVYNLDVVSDSVFTHIRKLSAYKKVLVIADPMTSQCLRKIFRAGACGFILRDSPIRQFGQALVELSLGRIYLDPGLAATALGSVDANAAVAGLTEREGDVLRLLAKGFTNREIAAALVISVRTVETHRANLQRKLRVQCRSELILLAEQRGWLEA